MIRFGKEKVLLLHQILIEQTGGEDGVHDMGLLESALAACDATFDGKELFPTKEEKAARLCTGLVSNHAFVDGNKRIGVYVMLTFLEVNGIRLNVTDEELVEIGLFERPDHDSVYIHAFHDAYGVAYRFAASQLYIARGQEQGIAAELANALLEGNARACGRFFKYHRKRFSCEVFVFFAGVLLALEFDGAVQQLEYLFGRIVHEREHMFIFKLARRQLIRHIVYFRPGNDVGRCDAQCVVSACADNHAEAEHFADDSGGVYAFVQAHAAKQSLAADVEYELMPRKLARQRVREIVARFGYAFEQVGVLQLGYDDVSRRAGERTSAERRAVVAGSERFGSFAARQAARYRHPAAQSFRESDYIRLYAVMFEAVELARTPRTRLHLVEYEQSEITELNPLAEQFMRAAHEVYLARGDELLKAKESFFGL